MRTVDESNAMFCSGLLKHANFDGKRILDIGCGNGDLVKYIAKHYSPANVVGIEPALDEHWETSESSGKNWRIVSGNAHNLDFDDNSFDLIISFSTFEHIGNISKALAEIKRVLCPFGKFYTEFMPIWTSAAGHHFLREKDRWWNTEHIKMIPAWGHLYMSENKMREHLSLQSTDSILVNEIIEFIYHSDCINRYSRYDLLQRIMNSEMIVRHYEERISFNRLSDITGEKTSELTDNILTCIERTEYKIFDLGISGMRICLEKYS